MTLMMLPQMPSALATTSDFKPAMMLTTAAEFTGRSEAAMLLKTCGLTASTRYSLFAVT